GGPGGRPGRSGMPPAKAFGGVPLDQLVGCPGRANPVNLSIQFNILYNLGAFPTISYADGAWEHTAATKEEVYDYLRNLGHVDEDREETFRANVDKRMTQTGAGLWRYAYESQMYVLGWDPNELDWDYIAKTSE
ncbi:MAG: hypothetical protein IJF51_01060, partial [Clostridia bacterium]|nr:hypothetical protein [Clostridia bacterium]